MHGRWGKLPLAEIATPAIALARRGLPQDWYTTLKVAICAPILRKYPESARIYLRDGLPPVPPYQGALPYFRLGRLGDTLERLAQAGWRDFYEGEIAASIAADVRAMGGVLSAQDLAACRARVLPAVGSAVARTHAAAHRPAHGGADRDRRAAADGRACRSAGRRTPPGTWRSRAR